ncbi:hypothetical protein [Bradyrhizobium sp. SSUT77]|uniref:hypothetical protein n=1 Tax=Bradyrhizobium sp. SSUT77 TaxID=3040603 RepID=UPI0024478E54|nr:hypothetical protein [Bradyrhizobium sp. SSUT77]MDH2341545.1 hypothetical protein [Bradyrhizobium sp. SSUT77]
MIHTTRPTINGGGIFAGRAGAFVRQSVTPVEFRTSYNEWKKTAPANDSDIFRDNRLAEHPRHAGMCVDLKAMLEWRDMKESRDPLQTNFLQAGKDDEIVSGDGVATLPSRDAEGEWEMRPTVDEIMKACSGVKLKTSYDHVISIRDGLRVYFLREKRIPDLDAPENRTLIGYGAHYESTVFNESGGLRKSDNEKGLPIRPIVRLGTLRFSDADGFELRPRGALLSQLDRRGTPYGGSSKFAAPPEITRLNPLERLVAMEVAVAANDNLAPGHMKALDATLTAKSFREVGAAFGYVGKTAERRGKQFVEHACEAFSEVLKKLAA